MTDNYCGTISICGAHISWIFLSLLRTTNETSSYVHVFINDSTNL